MISTCSNLVVGPKPTMPKRGFDCITYAGTVFNAQTTNMGALADLATEIAPTPLQVKLAW